jgi:hypothetical protein
MNRRLNPAKALSIIIDNLVFLVAALILFLKTSEVLTAFAPNTIFGYHGLESLYGIVTALLVEGLLVTAKLSLSRNQTSYAWLYSLILVIVTGGISAFAQITDGFLVKQTLANQPPMVQFLVNTGVPLVPFIILALSVGKTVFESLPEVEAATKTEEKQPQKAAGKETRQFAADAAAVKVRKNELSAADKDEISRMSSRQIMAKFGVEGRTARDWRKAARSGKL